MRDFEREILDLRQKTQKTRRQFLHLEVQTCFIAVDRGHLQLSFGNPTEAQKELDVAGCGVEVIERFLNREPDQVAELQAKLAELKEAMNSLRVAVEKFPG